MYGSDFFTNTTHNEKRIERLQKKLFKAKDTQAHTHICRGGQCLTILLLNIVL